eukprot:2138116-Amphidinium_carterae.1
MAMHCIKAQAFLVVNLKPKHHDIQCNDNTSERLARAHICYESRTLNQLSPTKSKHSFLHRGHLRVCVLLKTVEGNEVLGTV